MKNPHDEKAMDAYWRYLEENSKVVAGWPDWLKGERPSAPTGAPEHKEKYEGQNVPEELAS